MVGTAVNTSIATERQSAGREPSRWRVLGDHDALMLQQVVMIPAMLGVMLCRYDEYAQHHE